MKGVEREKKIERGGTPELGEELSPGVSPFGDVKEPLSWVFRISPMLELGRISFLAVTKEKRFLVNLAVGTVSFGGLG